MTVDEFLDLKWDGLQKHLREIFEDGITEGSQHSVAKLKQYVQSIGVVSSLQHFHAYYTGYLAQAKPLNDRNQLNDVELAGYFVGGLDSTSRKDILGRVQAARAKTSQVSLSSAESTSAKSVDQAGPATLAEIRREGVLYFKKDDFFSEQIDDIGGVGEEAGRNDRYKLQLRDTEKEGVQPSSSTDNGPEMTSLTRQMKELQIMVTRLSSNPPVPTNAWQTQTANTGTVPHATGTIIPAGANVQVVEMRPCFYDGALVPCTARGKLACEGLRADQAKGIVRLADDTMRTLLYPDGAEVPFNPGRMAEAVRQRAEATLSIRSNVITWSGESPPDPDSADCPKVATENTGSHEDENWILAIDPFDDEDKRNCDIHSTVLTGGQSFQMDPYEQIVRVSFASSPELVDLRSQANGISSAICKVLPGQDLKASMDATAIYPNERDTAKDRLISPKLLRSILENQPPDSKGHCSTTAVTRTDWKVA